jgi:hypothetical protein
MRYVNIYVTTSFFAPQYISWGNGGVIGDGENTLLPSQPFLLTKPSGSNFDLISEDSELYQAVTDFFSQPNTNTLWVMNSPSEGATIEDEAILPIDDTDDRLFQIRSTNFESLNSVYEMASGTYQEVDASEYAVDTETGIVTFTDAQTNNLYANYTVDAYGYALKQMMSKDIQIIFKAGETNLTNLQRLIDHAELASSCQRFRMAFGMMPSGQALDSDWLSDLAGLRSNRFAYIAHKCEDSDAAACVAGTACGKLPNDSLTLENVVCDQDSTDPWTDDEEYSFNQNQIIALQPNRWVGSGVTCLNTYNMSGSSTDKWVDLIRTSDYLSLLLISRLTNPNIIGGIGFNKAGMAMLDTQIRAALAPALTKNIIDSLDAIVNPLKVIILKGDDASAEEKQYLLDRKSQRVIDDLTVVYTYPASPDQITLNLKSQ